VPLSARVAVNVALSGVDRSMSREQLDVAQAAAAAMDVARRGGDEGSSAGVRRTPLEAELSEQGCKPVDDACRAQAAATGGADDRPGGFAYPQQASKRAAQVRMHGDAPAATLFGDRVVDRKNVCDLARASSTIDHSSRAISQARSPALTDNKIIARSRAWNGVLDVLRSIRRNIWGVTTLACLPGMIRNSLLVAVRREPSSDETR